MPRRQSPNRILTDAEQRALLKLPSYSSAEIKSFLKPAEGLERVAPAVFAKLDTRPEIAKTVGLDLAALRQQLADLPRLNELEAAAYRLHRKAYENRMDAESDLYRALLKVNRIVQNADNSELEEVFADLTDWVASSAASSERQREEPADDDKKPNP